MHKFILKIHEYLEKASEGKVKPDEKLLEEFAQRVKDKLKTKLEEPKKEFKLSMSNVGRPLRQLMLEQKHGKAKATPDFMLKMLFGDLYEALVVYLLKASGVEVIEQDTKVTLPVKTKKGPIDVNGTLDIGIRIKDEGKIYDIKTASPWSFNNKFDAESILDSDDPFGYVDQLFGYAAASKKKAGGWIVINKVDGQMKVCDVNEKTHDEALKKSVNNIQEKVAYIVEGRPIPECQGVINEKFFGRETGNKILGPSCKFCSHKESVCHKGNITYRASVVSKAKDPKWEYYIGEIKA